MKKLLFSILAISAILTSCQNKPAEAKKEVAAAPVVVKVDTICFEHVENKVDIASVKLIINGDSISGDMHWHPFEKDGAHGTLKGIKKGDVITADYNYMIEGSDQVEEVVFKLESDKLSKLEGELEEKNGKMVLKNPAKAEYREVYNKIDCSKALTDKE